MTGLGFSNGGIDYENISQTEKQYRLLYGNESKWSSTTKAVYDVLFKNARRAVAGKEHNVTVQTIHAFLVRNKQKHDGMFKLTELQNEYEQAGQDEKI